MTDDVLTEFCDTKLDTPYGCSYVPGRTRRDMRLTFKSAASDADKIALTEMFYESGMIYSGGNSLFSISCESCRSCIPVRYPVADFVMSGTQEATRRKLRAPTISTSYGFNSKAHLREHWAVFHRYTQDRFPDNLKQVSSLKRLLAPFIFKMGTPITVMEIRNNDVLLGASINAETENTCFGIFYYYDPRMMHLEPGKQIVMTLIEQAREAGKTHVYVGPWNAESRALQVKTQYRPYELLLGGQWKRFDTPHPKISK